MVILNHSNFLRPIDNDVIVILLYFIFIGEYFFLLSLGTGLECKYSLSIHVCIGWSKFVTEFFPTKFGLLGTTLVIYKLTVGKKNLSLN